MEMKSLIADAINTSAELGDRASVARFTPMVEALADLWDETTERHLVRLQHDAPAEIKEFPRGRKDLHLSFATLQSFVDAVSDHETGGTVFVDHDNVSARWNMKGYDECDTYRLPLSFGESYSALRRLMDGVRQRELWEFLATDLYGCMSETLEFLIGGLSHYEKTSVDVDIQRSGVADVKHNQALTLVYKDGGEQRHEIEIDWVYEGPVWDCYDRKITIPLRMVVSKDEKGLVFRFCPRGLKALMLDYRAALANDIVVKLEEADCDSPVYEGRA